MHNNIGALFKKQGDRDTAMRHFSRAVSLDPMNAGALNNRGVMLMENGQLEVARKHFIRALEISPGYQEARLNLDEVQKRINDGASNKAD